MKKGKRNYSPEEKVSALRRHLIDKVQVSDLCDELGISPNTFYLWQKTFFDNGTFAFKSDNSRRDHHKDRQITALKDKLKDRNEVLAELMHEHVALKKTLGVI